MSNKLNKVTKRHSAPSAAAGSQSQLMGWGPPTPMYYPPYQGWGQPSTSQAGGPMFASQPFLAPQPAAAAAAASKPWDSDNSDDSDFETPKKKKKARPESGTCTATTAKKRGRPTKADVELKEKKKNFLANLPNEPDGRDTVCFKDTGACKGCHLYVGRLALKPCGHALFCFSCVLKLLQNAKELCQFSKCPIDSCRTLVKDWVLLFNVSA